MSFMTKTVKVTTTGGGGAATGTASIGIPPGKLIGLSVNYDSMPAGTDVVITCVSGGLTKTLLTLTDNNADKPLMSVMEIGVDNTGTAIAADQSLRYLYPAVEGVLTVAVAQANAGVDAVIVHFLLEV